MEKIYAQNKENIIKKTDDGATVVFPRTSNPNMKFHGFFKMGPYETFIFDSFDEKRTLANVFDLVKLKLSDDNTYKKTNEGDLSDIFTNFVNRLIEKDLIKEIHKK